MLLEGLTQCAYPLNHDVINERALIKSLGRFYPPPQKKNIYIFSKHLSFVNQTRFLPE
jgi:hypothetical protein